MKRIARLMYPLVVLIGTAVIATMLPAQSYGWDGSSPDFDQDAIMAGGQPLPEPSHIVGEDANSRTVNSKTFRLSDGSYQMASYPIPIHTKDSAGKFQDLDNTLELVDQQRSTDSVKVWENQVGDQSFTLTTQAIPFSAGDIESLSSKSSQANTSNDNAFGTVSMMVANQKVSWGYDGVSPSTIEFQDKDASKLSGDEQFLTLANLSNSAIYPNALPFSDLHYVVTPTGVKENIIVNDRKAGNSWVARFNIGDLHPKQTDDKTIELFDDSSLALVISTPFMVDAVGNRSNGVSMKMSVSRSLMTLTITADKRFLNNRSTKFPVVVDPTFTLPNRSSIHNDTVIYSANPNTNFGNDRLADIGYQSALGASRLLARIDNMPLLPAGSVITEAKMGWYGYTFGNPVTVEAHRITGAWTQYGANWSNTNTLFDPLVEDYVTVTTQNDRYYVDLTRLTKLWYENPGSYPNYGVMMMAPDAEAKHGNFDIAEFYTSKALPIQDTPTFTISYRSHGGLEDYWTFHSQSLNGGVGHINDYSGNLVFDVPIAETTGLNMPVGVDFIYNGYTSDQQYRNNTKGSVNGYGWMHTLGQRLEHVSAMAEYASLANDLILAGYEYVWIDMDGTHHFFKQDSPGVFKDEDGLGLTLTTNQRYESLSGVNIIESLGGQKSVFLSDGRLQVIANAMDQKVSLAYSGLNLSTVTDGAGRQLVFSYSGSTITAITGPEGTVSFTYSNGELIKVSFPDGTSIDLTYHTVIADSKTYHRLSLVFGRDGGKLIYVYQYYANPIPPQQATRVMSAGEYATDLTSGNSITMDYSKQNETKVTYYKDSGTVYETYQFDHWGRTLSVLNADGSSTTASNSGASASVSYTPTSNQVSGFGKNNKITKVAAGSRFINNMLINHNAESNSSWLETNWSTTNSVYTLDTVEKYLGNKSFKVYQSYPSPTRSGWKQSVSVQANTTYTLSAYIKTSGVIPSGAGTGATVYVAENAGSSLAKYDECDTEVTGTTNDWQRVSMTFTTSPTTTSVDAYVGLKLANGTAWFDAIQLELGDTANSYTMIENGDLTSGTGWGIANAGPGDGISGGLATLTGTPGYSRHVGQMIQVNKAGVGVYASGRAKAQAAPISDSNRQFDLAVGFYYWDGTPVEWTFMPFNPDVSTWQFASGMAAPSEANLNRIISSIYVVFRYYNQANTALFDDLMVTLDQTGAVYSYDAQGIVTKVVDNSGQSTSITLDNTTNQVTDVEDSDGEAFSFTYDPQNPYQLISSVDNQTGLGTEYTYGVGNNSANVTSTRTGMVGSMLSHPWMETSRQYSSNGAYVTGESDERGKLTSYNIDSNTGRINAATNPNNITTNYAYDPAKKTLNSVTTGSASVSYGYDAATSGNRLNKITHNGFAYNLEYDKWANLQSIKVGSNPLVTNTFANQNGNLTRTTYGNSQYLDYTYDKYDRITNVSANGIPIAGYTYDANDRLVRISDNKNGGTINYSYSGSGELLNLSNPQGSIVYGTNPNGTTSHTGVTFQGNTYNTVYSYLVGGNPDATVYPDGSTMTKDYDSFNRPITDDIDMGGPMLRRETTYLDLGRNQTTPLVAEYNNYKHTVRDDMPFPHGSAMFGYDYDNNGNITKITQTDGGYGTRAITYQYDSLDQLVRVNDKPQNKSFTYSYDNAGNLVSKSEYPYTTSTLGTPTLTIPYAYSDPVWKDKLTSYNGQPITYDAIGNPLSYRNGMSFTWQEGRQLASATTTSGQTVNYTYNPQGIRIGKTVGGTTTSYLVDEQGTIQAMQQGNDTLIFLYDSNGGREGFMWYTNNTFKGTYYYLYNAQSDVVGIIDSNLNQDAIYEYDAWGKPTITTNSPNDIANINPFRYRSYPYDNETGLYYLQSRYYDSETSRYINADEPLMLYEGEINLFSYCYNNPAVYSDPTGMAPKVGYMGIINASDLPSGSYSSNTIIYAGAVTWAVTSSFSSIAKYHCGAVAVTNLALYFAVRGKSALKVNNSITDTFKAIHPKYIGDGPVMTIADGAKKYFKSKGVTLNYSGAHTYSAVKKAIDNNRPVGVLIADGFSWHWVICIGYRKYSNGSFYMQVVDGWNNSTNKYYKPHSGAAWISGTQYWV